MGQPNRRKSTTANSSNSSSKFGSNQKFREIDFSSHKKNSSKSRIHSAVVSGINIDTRSVTVEWFDRGETKGKEVELETLLSLNQDLAPVNENGNKINKVKEEKKMKNRFHEFSFNQKKT